MDPETIEFLEKKAKEKGIKPKYPIGKKESDKKNKEMLIHRKLDRLERNQEDIIRILNRIVQYLPLLETKKEG